MNKRRMWRAAVGAVLTSLVLVGPAAFAADGAGTFSIVAYDARTNEWGVAVASRVLAVGYIVPWARADVGAAATQALANAAFGPEALALLAEGKSADETVTALIAGDAGREQRQLGVVDAQGRAAAFTGAETLPWSGHVTGEGYSCQGNILTGENVLREMARAFEGASGPLARRLVAALAAGDAAGGDKRGKESAALLVVRAAGGYQGTTDRLVDIRVDDAPVPVAELARIYELWEYRFLFPVYVEAAGDVEHALALDIAERVLREKEPDAETCNAVAWALANRKLYREKAVAIALRARELAPDDAAIMDTLAEAYYAAGDYGAAVEWGEKGLAAAPGDKYFERQLDKFRTAAAGAPGDKAATVFEFASGGAYHPAGYGEWRVRLDAAGGLAVEHDVSGVVKAFGPYELTADEQDRLASLVAALSSTGVASTDRPGVPDEVKYTFRYRREGELAEVSVWAGDASGVSAVAALLDELEGIINKYTGEKPVIR